MHSFSALAVIVLLSLTSLPGCSSQNRFSSEHQAELPEQWQPHLKPVKLEQGFTPATKQTVYVPVYSHIYYEDNKRWLELAETLSVRNTDIQRPLILKSVRYYNTEGKLLKEYLNTPVLLEPLATADFVVARTDLLGGSGANFLVEWLAKEKVSEPILEAIMISAGSDHNISFASRGVVIKTAQQQVTCAGHKVREGG